MSRTASTFNFENKSSLVKPATLNKESKGELRINDGDDDLSKTGNVRRRKTTYDVQANDSQQKAARDIIADHDDGAINLDEPLAGIETT